MVWTVISVTLRVTAVTQHGTCTEQMLMITADVGFDEEIK